MIFSVIGLHSGISEWSLEAASFVTCRRQRPTHCDSTCAPDQHPRWQASESSPAKDRAAEPWNTPSRDSYRTCRTQRPKWAGAACHGLSDCWQREGIWPRFLRHSCPCAAWSPDRRSRPRSSPWCTCQIFDLSVHWFYSIDI